MKSALCLVGLSWLLSASASAQQQPTCPTLPPTAGLQWNQQAGSDYLVCKATTIADGRQVIGMMFTTRDPNIALSRDRRAEKGTIGPESMYWYRLDLGGNTLPEMESRRITVVELGKHRYAQIWIDASSGSELTSTQSLVQSLNLEPASLAISR
jgi:hypothetical protein